MRVISAFGEILFAGLVALLPIYLTIQVLVWVFRFVDREVGSFVVPLIGEPIPGTGIVVTFLVVFLAGLFTRWWLTNRILGLFDLLLLKMPLTGQIYGAVKRLLDPISRKEDRPFRQAVWVHLTPEMKVLGFITSGEMDVGAEVDDRRVSVYLPSCHPYFGMVTAVRREDLQLADIHLDEAISYYFSFGAATPHSVKVDHTETSEVPKLPDPAG